MCIITEQENKEIKTGRQEAAFLMIVVLIRMTLELVSSFNYWEAVSVKSVMRD